MRVDQFDGNLIVSCPLTPTLAFVDQQTQQSLEAVNVERYDLDAAQRPSWTFRSHVGIGALPAHEVTRLNLVCVLNAQRYVYANYLDDELLRFLDQYFFGALAPVRRGDLQPIGSPAV